MTLSKAQQICLELQDQVDEHKFEFIKKMQQPKEETFDSWMDDDPVLKPKRKLFNRKKSNEQEENK